FSTDATYPYYINWQFAEYERGKRINDRLSTMKNATADSLRLLQTDDYSIWAQDVLPTMLSYVDESKLDKGQAAAFKIVKAWNKHFSVDAVGATIFSSWWKKFYGMTWNRHFKDSTTMYRLPSRDKTEELLLKQPNSKWFDNPRTEGMETAADIVNRAFIATADELIKQYGKPGSSWQWGKIKEMEVSHLAGLDGMGSGKFESGGTGTTVNAIIDGHGPSWRMVVQTGAQVKGYGILPGGQSGNPGSYYYDDMFSTWKAGKLDELLFLLSDKEQSDRIKGRIILNKKN
ncbi:MAG: penicillin acylase family protein, partial [Sphingobacteriaceae bacterium]